LETRPKQVDEYALGTCLGTGLTGSAYLATRPGPDGHLRQVVLKLVDPARAVLLPWAARLMDELDPRVARYEAVGARSRRSAGHWVTDVVRAEPLDWVVDHVRLEARVRAVADVAEAIAALHAERLVHGHLLPQNVLLRRERAGGLSIVVTDAGVRPKYDPAFHDGPEVAPRLYPYLAPEAIEALRAGKNETLERPADVYALGAVALSLLTGRGPGAAEGERTCAEILRSKERRTYAVHAVVDPDEPVDLARLNDVLRRCLAARPGDRPTAAEAASALRAALLTQEPVQ
jgi:hypothetical protein